MGAIIRLPGLTIPFHQILCIGQHHNHELISSQEPSLLSDKGSLEVKPTLQLNHPDYDHIFAIGDVAHTTAIKAGHVGYWQAGVAVENIVKLLEGQDESALKVYEPTKPMIKVTVGKVSREYVVPDIV